MPGVGGCPTHVEPARGLLGIHDRGVGEAGVVIGLVGLAPQPLGRPVVGERDLVGGRQQAERVVEGVHVAIAEPRLRAALPGGAPVDELHGHLVTGVTLTHPFFLGDTEVVEESALEVGDGGFSDTDPWNARGLQNHDLHRVLKRFAEVGCGHPASGTPAEDHNRLDAAVHGVSLIRWGCDWFRWDPGACAGDLRAHAGGAGIDR